MEQLIDFDWEWPVDRHGYEWVLGAGGDYRKTFQSLVTGPFGMPIRIERPAAASLLGSPAEWLLRGRGGPKSDYRPLQEHPGLFRRFALLDPGNRDAIREFITDFGELGEPFHSFESIRDAIIRFKMMVHALDAPLVDRHGAAVIFQDMFHLRFRMTLNVDTLSPVFVPETLYGAMAVQIAEEIAGVAKFKKCKNCPVWFPLGKSKGTARKEFCTPKCRVAWNRKCHRKDTE